MQVQLHVGILAAEIADHARQHVARLRMRGADGQRATIGLLEVLGQALERLRLAQHAQRARRHLFAGRREAFEGAAITHEQREAELLFKQTDLLADARLGSVQRLGGSRDVEAVLHNGREISKLLQLQIELRSGGSC